MKGETLMRKVEKILCGLIACVMLFTGTIPAYAVEEGNEQDGVTIFDSAETTEIYLEDENATITIRETDESRIVTVWYAETGTTEELIYNKTTNSLYSTITGETVIFGDEAAGEPSGPSPLATSTTSVTYVSWATLRSTIGETATIVSMVAYLAAKFGVVGAAALGSVSTIVGFGSLFIPNDSSHGLAITVKTTKYYRTRNGTRSVYRIINTVTGVATY